MEASISFVVPGADNSEQVKVAYRGREMNIFATVASVGSHLATYTENKWKTLERASGDDESKTTFHTQFPCDAAWDADQATCVFESGKLVVKMPFYQMRFVPVITQSPKEEAL
jgi:hypothetical protein